MNRASRTTERLICVINETMITYFVYDYNGWVVGSRSGYGAPEEAVAACKRFAGSNAELVGDMNIFLEPELSAGCRWRGNCGEFFIRGRHKHPRPSQLFTARLS